MTTAGDVETYFYNLLKQSKLAKSVNGEIYFNGYRPTNSSAEDIIITYTAGLAGQISRGNVKINIYVKDIDVYGDGTLRKDKARCDELARIASDWVESIELSDNYWIKLARIIDTYEVAQIGQHAVFISLDYKHFEL